MKRALLLIMLFSTPALAKHRALEIENKYERPEDVVRYYCDRDSEGFVWSGLLDIERRKFTEWETVPNVESFLIAESFKIMPTKVLSTSEVEVPVEYKLNSAGDAFGTRTPASERIQTIFFKLRKQNGQWRISSPGPNAIQSIVLEEHVKSRRSTASE